MELLAAIAGLVAFLVAVICASERYGILRIVGGIFLLLAVLAWSGY